MSGKPLVVYHPGRWNKQEGPDFIGARLEIDGEAIAGDVEVHFKLADWVQHGHGEDPAFKHVILHALMYPDPSGRRTATTLEGRAPEVFVMGHFLNEDLENFANDEALREMETALSSPWVEAFLRCPLDERLAALQAGARHRWAQKRSFAAKRLAKTDWAAACHQCFLEVMGYRRNRAPMGRIALEHSLRDFSKSGEFAIDEVYDKHREEWRLAGLRPANHPKLRLKQYRQICQNAPDWPERVRQCFEACLDGAVTEDLAAFAKTRAYRRKSGMRNVRQTIGKEIFGGMLNGPRLDTLIVDALLPLLDASGCGGAATCWEHWFPGDTPNHQKAFLRAAALAGENTTLVHSNGLNQGAIELFLKSQAS